ncbi:ribonuclease P protein component [Planctomonas psychrotolerans]|uniref:ribonuclease P protein component n=1 Tax=Planctomonas psychrotolerans TaxID=2528712 RepID=UPI00123864F6|nr:ribonuclease P protein component [Planctomonas psychrotolerans]
MLAKPHRLTSAADYRAVVRRGRRYGSPHAVCYVRASTAATPARFGFIVSKKVGIANRRNLVRRRLKAIGHELVSRIPAGTDIVIRALPGSDDVPWATLHTEIITAIDKSVGTA